MNTKGIIFIVLAALVLFACPSPTTVNDQNITKTVGGVLSYGTIDTPYGTSAEEDAVWTNPAEGQTVSYSIVKKDDSTAVDGISVDANGKVSVAATANAMVATLFTVTAKGTGGYSGEVSGEISITVQGTSIGGTFTYGAAIVTPYGSPAEEDAVWTNPVAGQTLSYSIVRKSDGSTLPGVTVDENGKVVVSNTASAMETTPFTVSAKGIEAFMGTVTAEISITVQGTPIGGTFTYGAIDIVYGSSAEEAAVWTNPTAGQTLSYSIVKKDDATAVDGITVDADGKVSVAATANSMAATQFTVSARGIGAFMGTIEADISIKVDQLPIGGSFTYTSSIVTNHGTEAKEAAVWTNPVAGQTLSYTIGKKVDSTFVDGITVDDIGQVIVSDTANVMAETVFTVNAEGIGNYAGKRTADISIKVDKLAIEGSFAYVSSIVTDHGTEAEAAAQWTGGLAGQTVSYNILKKADSTFVDGITVDDSGKVIVSDTANAMAETVFTVSAEGSGNYSGTVEAEISITVNRAALTGFRYSQTDYTAQVGQSLTAEPIMEPSGATATFKLAASSNPLPDWLTLNTDGSLTGTPAAADTTTDLTYYTIIAEATENYEGTQQVIVGIEVKNLGNYIDYVEFVKEDNGNTTPVSDGGTYTTETYTLGKTFEVEAEARVIGNAASTIVYSTTETEVLSINGTTVTILKASQSPVPITATSTNNADSSDVDTATVYAVINRKTLTSNDISYPTGTSATIGASLTFSPSKKPGESGADIEFIDPNQALPPGLTLDKDSGEITGTPGQGAELGTKTYVITARIPADAQSYWNEYYTGSASIDVPINISKAVFSSLSFYDGSGDLTSIARTYLDGDFNLKARTSPAVEDAKYTFSVASGTSVALSNDTTTADFINDKAAIASAGDTEISVSVTAPGYETTTKTLTISVAKKTLDSGALSYSPNSVAVAKNSAITPTPTPTVSPAEAGTGAAYELVPSTASLPNGLTLGSDGTITGTVGDTASSGSNTYTVRLIPKADGNFEGSPEAAITIDVKDSPGVYGISFDQTGPIEKTFSDDQSFTLSVTAVTVGVTATVSYTVSAGTDVLEISDSSTGVVSIKKAGSGTITATAVNDQDASDSRDVTIDVTVHKKSISLSYDTTAINGQRSVAFDDSYQLPSPTLEPQGAAVSFAVAPALPPWLELNTSDGSLSFSTQKTSTTVGGKSYEIPLKAPNDVLTETYTITATATGTGNYQGTSTVDITINVDEIDKIWDIKFLDSAGGEINNTPSQPLTVYYYQNFYVKHVAITSGQVSVGYDVVNYNYTVQGDFLYHFTDAYSGGATDSIEITAKNGSDSANTVFKEFHTISHPYPLDQWDLSFSIKNTTDNDVRNNAFEGKIGDVFEGARIGAAAPLDYHGVTAEWTRVDITSVKRAAGRDAENNFDFINGEDVSRGSDGFRLPVGMLSDDGSVQIGFYGTGWRTAAKVADDEAYQITVEGDSTNKVTGTTKIVVTFDIYGVETVEFTDNGGSDGNSITEKALTSGNTFDLETLTYTKSHFKDSTNTLSLRYEVESGDASTTVTPGGEVTAGSSGTSTVIRVTATDASGSYNTKTADITINVQ